MKMIFGIIGIFILSGFLFYITSCNEKSKVNGQGNSSQNLDTSKMIKTKVEENPYPALREQSLSITAEQLQLNLDNSKTIAYGIIMEWDLTDVVVSVVTFQTGDASLYISTGQIYMGGFTHENVNEAAKSFVENGQEFLKYAKPITETPLPYKNCVRFYFLTNKGKFYIQETVENIENNKSNLTKLFDLGNKVITEYREITDNK